MFKDNVTFSNTGSEVSAKTSRIAWGGGPGGVLELFSQRSL